MMIITFIPIVFLYSSTSLASTNVLVLGDLEGDIKKLDSFLESSHEFTQRKNGTWTIQQGSHFVFAGDAVDKKPGNIRVLKKLLQLKQDFPDQVTLLAGNRDIQKLTMYNYMKKSFDEAYDVLSNAYTKVLVEENLLDIESKMASTRIKSIAAKFDSDIIRLKVLYEIMNTNNGFDNIKNELILLNPKTKILDADVVEHFYKSMSKGGLNYEYISKSEIGKVIDNTLYVHGAVTKSNIGHVPLLDKKVTDLHTWVKELNNFKTSQFNLWSTNHSNAQALINYASPAKKNINNPRSVIYNRFSDISGNVKVPPISVREYLANDGVNRIVSGHTPHNYSYVAKHNGFEVVLADISISTTEQSPIIRINENHIEILAHKENSSPIKTKISKGFQLLPDGLKTQTGHIVVGKNTKSDKYILMKVIGKGRDFRTEYIEESLDHLFERGFAKRFNSGDCQKIFLNPN